MQYILFKKTNSTSSPQRAARGMDNAILLRCVYPTVEMPQPEARGSGEKDP